MPRGSTEEQKAKTFYELKALSVTAPTVRQRSIETNYFCLKGGLTDVELV
jgi:hypothetical protein